MSNNLKPYLGLSICALFLLVVGLYQSPSDIHKNAEVEAEKLMQEIPDLRTFVEDHFELLTAVQETFDQCDVPVRIRTGEDGIVILAGKTAEPESISTTDLFVQEEKDEIIELFSDDSPLKSYSGGVYKVKGSERVRPLADLRLSYIPEDKLESWGSDYMEELKDGWYAYAVMNW